MYVYLCSCDVEVGVVANGCKLHPLTVLSLSGEPNLVVYSVQNLTHMIIIRVYTINVYLYNNVM